MATLSISFPSLITTCSVQKPSTSHKFHNFNTSAFKPLLKHLPMQLDFGKVIKNGSMKMLDAIVDVAFEYVDDEDPSLPSQRNFLPVEDQLREAVTITSMDGKIPNDFPVGAYLRNGPNPLFGRQKSTKSVFGKSSPTWLEGEGMIHGLYFDKDSGGEWIVAYNNRSAETETFKIEKQRNKPAFLPATIGDSPAILVSTILNLLRFGKAAKDYCNTNVFEHGGKLYSTAENHMPLEIDLFTLQVLGNWDVLAAWNRPCTSHPKRVPGSGELVIHGSGGVKPFLEIGIISADGNRLLQKTDLKLERGSLCHELGITERYNVILDFPLSVSVKRLVTGGPLIKYDKEDYARIGVMPRYGNADSVRWFDVLPNSTFHILNCFEDGDEVVVWGCRSLECVIPGPDRGLNIYDWYSKRIKTPSKSDDIGNYLSEDELLFTRVYEWRLNMKSGEVKEKSLTGIEFSMDFPMINQNFVGLKNKYGYTQVVDTVASSQAGLFKYGSLAKLYLEHQVVGSNEVEDQIKIEYHQFEKNSFCSGATFVPKEGSVEEDDGWIITFVHNENSDISQVHVIDARKFSSEPVAKITIPYRVPYGFHGAFMSIPPKNQEQLS